MSEPIGKRLSRFTPDAGGLDRDALLFAAGRASARPSRRWKAVAGALAASQLLTLALLWPHTPQAAGPAPAPPQVAVQPSPPPPAAPDSWAVNWLRAPDGPPPPAAADFVPDDPPLRASGADAALVN